MKTKWRERTGDTNITPGKGKQRNKVAEIGLRPAGAVGDSFKKYRKEVTRHEEIRFKPHYDKGMENLP
ncbi:MAG: hypothetical protein Q4F03_07365 [Eubacteriales bacterium]|nr:hypothetical protein [Eubacteriales bacterium]